MDPAVEIEMQVLSRQKDMNELIALGDSDVQKFYKDAVVFATGSSGFVGKLLVEKLLRSCDLKKIYLLLRDKKGKTGQERLEKTFKDPLFDTLRKIKPNFENKVVVIEGNVTSLKLGIRDDDWTKLTNEVNVIFHVAATTNFDEPLRLAATTNVRGTIEALSLGKACKNLRSYVHVSTAYTHATSARIGTDVYEKFYEPPLAPTALLDLIGSFTDQQLIDMKTQLIGAWPNTYAFTKAIGEEAVRTMSGDLPICIVRPAIVISTANEPAPGWLDLRSVYGPSGLVFGCGMGVMHTYMADDRTSIGLIPADIVNNATIAAGWSTAQRRARGETEIKIYAVAPTRKPLLWKTMSDILYTKASKLTTPKVLWYNFDYHTPNKFLFWVLTWLFHYIPGYFIDGVLIALGKQPQAIKLYGLAYKMGTVLSFYTCNSWRFDDINLENMFSSLSLSDKTMFNFDINCINWDEMMVIWAIGLRRYIVKDGLKDTDYGLKKQKIFKYLNYLFLFIYAFTLYKAITFLVWLLSFTVSLIF